MSRVRYGAIARALAGHGMIARGAFRPAAGEGLPTGTAMALMVGNAGPGMWRFFQAGRRDEVDAMNRWTRRVLDAVAAAVGASAHYPFDGPPWLPFQRWAGRAEAVFASPVGMSIHPQHGLWHAWRGVLAFADDLADLPPRRATANPCESCVTKPCLTACPAGAFSADGYDVPACGGHLRQPAGADCMALGCRARRACPVGRDATYLPAQAAFHMTAFLAAHGGAEG